MLLTTSLGMIHLAVSGGTGAIQTRLTLLMLLERSDVGCRGKDEWIAMQCAPGRICRDAPAPKKRNGYNALGEQVVAAIVEEWWFAYIYIKNQPQPQPKILDPISTNNIDKAAPQRRSVTLWPRRTGHDMTPRWEEKKQRNSGNLGWINGCQDDVRWAGEATYLIMMNTPLKSNINTPKIMVWKR